MSKEGYDRNFSAAVTTTAATTGLLIPPSNVLIIYAVASGGVSIAALFVAGYIPGILVSIGLAMVCAVYAKRRGLPRGDRLPLRIVLHRTFAALPSLFLIVLVIGGILGGVFTATEAGAIAVLYAFALSALVYREIRLSDLRQIVLKAAETTAIVMFLIATSMAMSWILAYENIPAIVAETLVTLSDNPILILLLINLVLLLVGIFMDMTPAVLIFTPIFLPVAMELGISPLHFGIIMVLNLCIGLCTPPVGSILFVGCVIAKTSIGKIIRPMLPMYAAMFVVLMFVTYFPALSEFLPRYFGLID
jgi:tripartite ATP-independent transporter DctM subunit